MSESQVLRTTCEVEGKNIGFCDALADALEGTNGNYKGITSLHTMNLKTGEEFVRGAILKSGNYRKRGIMINFCPFCGVEIVTALRERIGGGEGG